MSFFDSEIVRKEMEEITEMQEDIYRRVFEFPTMTNKDKADHVDKLADLLEKQKILYTRLNLSDDPEAIQMRESIKQSAVAMGMPKDVDLGNVFNNMSKILENMRASIQEKD